MGGGGVEPGDVGADQPGLEGSPALDAGEDRSPPAAMSHGTSTTRARSRNKRRGCRLDAPLEMAAQRERLQRGHAHALPVDRVEAAHRVAHHEQPVREAAQSLVAVPDAGREAEGDRVVERLGVADGLVDVGEPQRPGEVEEAVGVGRRVVAQDAGQRHHPPVAFQRLQRPGPRMLGRRGVQDRQVAAEGVGRAAGRSGSRSPARSGPAPWPAARSRAPPATPGCASPDRWRRPRGRRRAPPRRCRRPGGAPARRRRGDRRAWSPARRCRSGPGTPRWAARAPGPGRGPRGSGRLAHSSTSPVCACRSR